MTEVIWHPPADRVARSPLTRLARTLGAADYAELHRISVEEPDRFWPAVVADLGIEFSEPWARVLDDSRGAMWARWFPGGRLNIARACVHRWADVAGEALVGRYEDGARESLSWAELSRQVTQLAEALVELGVQPGDRVAIFMPMCPAVAVASHACAHVGAVQVPIFSGFGAPAIRSRLDDSEAKVVICADWSLRRGKRVDMRAVLDETGDHTVLEWNRETRSWPELVTKQPGELPPLEVDSEHPYLLAYTSGTTGTPKGAVHVHGGFLVSIAREAAYQTEIVRGDRVHFATDMGWIMGPWTVVGAGACGATVVFAEGAPDWPDDRLWELVESERVTMLGLSPTLVRALIPKGDPTHDRSSLKAFCTTGEPWNPDPYLWLFGVEDVHVLAERRPVRGEVGELVCKRPWPGMTRGIWRDADGSRFRETYWSRFPGVWTHGDWASIDEDGYWFLHGRSDDTMNIAGKRIGPAELESAAIGSGIVAEAAAVGVPPDVKGEVAWSFCVATPGASHDDAAVLAAVTDELGKAFKPDRILWVDALPKTRSAKIVRRAGRARVLGKDPGDLSSLENPESLDQIGAVIA